MVMFIAEGFMSVVPAKSSLAKRPLESWFSCREIGGRKRRSPWSVAKGMVGTTSEARWDRLSVGAERGESMLKGVGVPL